MEEKDYKRKRFENGAPRWFYVACLLDYNFKTFKRFLIYIFHFSGFIDLRKKSSNQYTTEDIVQLLEIRFPIKIERTFLYEITGCSKNTFKKHFGIYLQEKSLVEKRKFTLSEAYHLLNYWQGDGKWALMNAVKKKTLSDILHSGDYKKLSEEFELYIGHERYKRVDKLAPREVKGFFKHIDALDSEEAEKTLRTKKQEDISLLLFGLLIFQDAMYNRPTNLDNHNLLIVQM